MSSGTAVLFELDRSSSQKRKDRMELLKTTMRRCSCQLHIDIAAIELYCSSADTEVDRPCLAKLGP